MTKAELLPVMAYIAAAIGKPFPADAVEVYFDLLGDLPLDVLKISAKRVVLEHKWATFPSVAELREAASETMRGQVKELSPAEAWDIAWRAAGKIDLEVEGQADRVLAKVPALVVEAMRAFGLPALCYGKEPVGVLRGQFLKTFEQLAARERRVALLPAAVKRDVLAIGDRNKALPAPAQEAIQKIGEMPGTT